MDKENFARDVNETLTRKLEETSSNRRIKLLSFDYSLFRRDRDFVSTEEEERLPEFVRWTLETVRERGMTCRVESDTAVIKEGPYAVGTARQWTVVVNPR